jgi:ubiquinone biosynthesis protein Coq4
LLRHARTFGTLTNTEVGTKEMVHRTFKTMVPRTNRKNIEFDLLKRYTTLQSIRHLADGGIDPRNLQSNAEFMSISKDFNHLFKDWFIIETAEMDNEELKGN